MKTLWESCGDLADEAVGGEKRFAAAALAGRNCFLTGMAGTGKSTTLRAFIRDSVKRVDVTATTGVAALNVGGMDERGWTQVCCRKRAQRAQKGAGHGAIAVQGDG